MKKDWTMRFVKSLLLSCILVIFAVSRLEAQTPPPLAGTGSQIPFTFVFDEFGIGSIDVNNAGLQPWQGYLAPDPSLSGINSLHYNLPQGVLVATGDVRIYEENDPERMGPPSDVVRFTNDQGDLSGAPVGNMMIFYSDNAEPDMSPKALADTGLPEDLYPRDNGGVSEEVVQTPMGILTTFTWGAFTNSTIYKGISDLITLDQFEAVAQGNQIILSWTTLSEIDNAGFNIWRSDKKDGKYTKINSKIIEAQGGATEVAEYAYSDNTGRPGVRYYYKLEDIDTRGASTFHEPVLAMIQRKAAADYYPPYWVDMYSKPVWPPVYGMNYSWGPYYPYP